MRNGNLLYRKYREFFLPTILAGVASSMSIIIDSMLVGNMLGPTEMAAVNLCMPVMQTYYMISVLIGMGASTLISINLGKRNKEGADLFFNLSGLVLVLISLSISLVGIPLVNQLANVLTTEPDLIPLVHAYLLPMLWGNMPLLFLPAVVYILRTDGFVRLASTVLIVANAVNLTLDAVFMGPLQMGILGSSLATVCGYSVGIALLSTYVFSKERTLTFQLTRAIFKRLAASVREMLLTGMPAALGIGLVAVKLFFMNHLVGHLAGSDGLIVFSVCLSCLSFMSMFISGTAGTMMPIVGTLLGERDFRGIRFIMRYALYFSLVVSTAVIVLFECFPEAIFSLFGAEGNADVLAMGVTGLRLFSISLLGVSITFITMYYFLTIRQSGIANVISVTEGLLFPVPLAWALSLFMGLEGVWTAYIVTEVLAMMLTFTMIRYKRRKKENKELNALLIPDVASEVLYENTLKVEKASCKEWMQQVQQDLKSSCKEVEQPALLTAILDDIVLQIQQLKKNKRSVWMDVRVLNQEKGIRLLVRNDGASQNPTEGLSKKFVELADKITYTRILSLNQLQIEINK